MKLFIQILQAESEPQQKCGAGGPPVPELQTQPDVHLQVPRLDWLLGAGRRSQGRLAGMIMTEI